VETRREAGLADGIQFESQAVQGARRSIGQSREVCFQTIEEHGVRCTLLAELATEFGGVAGEGDGLERVAQPEEALLDHAGGKAEEFPAPGNEPDGEQGEGAKSAGEALLRSPRPTREGPDLPALAGQEGDDAIAL